MRRTDYIYLHTAGLLQTPAEKSLKLLHDLGEIFELKEPGRSGVVSLAGRGSAGESLNFSDWILVLWKEQVKGIHFSGRPPVVDEEDVSSNPLLPDHMRAAFVGGDNFFLRVVTGTADRLYTLQTQLSPPYAITADEFVELMDAQERTEDIWDKVTEMVTESNVLNGRPRIEITQIRDYLTSRNGASVFEFLVAELVSEIQVDCGMAGTTFRIPTSLQYLLYRSEFSFGSLPDGEETVYLYPVKSMTGAELLALVDAQLFAAEVWEKALQEFSDYEEIPVLGADKYPEYIIKETEPVILDRLANSLTVVIRNLCEEHHCRPVIPAQLREHIGPSEEEAARARVRSKLDKDKWYLNANDKPWELYFFELYPADRPMEPFAADEGGRRLAAAREDFRKLLGEITQFAAKMESPFEEAFALGTWFLDKWDSMEEREVLLAALAKDGFSERACENAGHSLYIIGEAKTFDWENARIGGLLAFDITDVFGGMGSWNDIIPDNEEDYDRYQELSAKLFATRRGFFMELMGTE